MCSLLSQSISNKKCVGQNAIRSMEWKKARHCPSKSAHVHIPNERIVKLDDKCEKFIFIGYENNSKRYKLYNPNNRKIVISQDVGFDEEEEWDFGSGVDDFNFFPIKEDDHTQIKQVEEQQEPSTPPIPPA